MIEDKIFEFKIFVVIQKLTKSIKTFSLKIFRQCGAINLRDSKASLPNSVLQKFPTIASYTVTLETESTCMCTYMFL